MFMVDHRSTGLPECGPTESSAPEPLIFFYFLQFLVELQLYLITATATAVINFSTTALEAQPRFSENSQLIHHYIPNILGKNSVAEWIKPSEPSKLGDKGIESRIEVNPFLHRQHLFYCKGCLVPYTMLFYRKNEEDTKIP